MTPASLLLYLSHYPHEEAMFSTATHKESITMPIMKSWPKKTCSQCKKTFAVIDSFTWSLLDDLCDNCFNGNNVKDLIIPEMTEEMKSVLISTAAVWYNGMGSGLYSFVKTGKIQSERLRQRMLGEIESEIADLTADNFQKTQTFSTEEIDALNDLRLYLKSTPIS